MSGSEAIYSPWQAIHMVMRCKTWGGRTLVSTALVSNSALSPATLNALSEHEAQRTYGVNALSNIGKQLRKEKISQMSLYEGANSINTIFQNWSDNWCMKMFKISR